MTSPVAPRQQGTVDRSALGGLADVIELTSAWPTETSTSTSARWGTLLPEP